MLLVEKTALIYGGGGAMGGAVARAFGHGATLHLAGRSRSKLDKVSVGISFNAVGLNDVQNRPLVGLAVDEFVRPVAEAARTQFVTATATARRMIQQQHGVIMMRPLRVNPASRWAASVWRVQP